MKTNIAKPAILPHRRNALSMAILSIAAVLLSGCTTASEPDTGPPTVLETPAMEWVGGIEPAQNDLENNAYIQVAREYYLARALTWNTGDFTISQFTKFFDDAQLDTFVSSYSRQGNRPIVYAAPKPFTVMSVDYSEANPDNQAKATVSYNVCFAPDDKYIISMPNSTSEPGENVARTLTFDLNTTDPRTFVVDNHPDLDCSDVTDIPVHRFVDAPKLPEVPVTRPVRDRIGSTKVWPTE